MGLDFKEIQMLYHTNIRNVALFTSVSLGLLGYSRYYRAKKYHIYNIAFILISLGFLYMSALLSYYLIKDHNYFVSMLEEENKINEVKMLDKWYLIPRLALGINVVVSGFGIFTLMRQLSTLKLI
tara:strand:+ start:2045 stop:2419 length:375 start_codon:yes stop_codon:yes gene_type:complete